MARGGLQHATAALPGTKHNIDLPACCRPPRAIAYRWTLTPRHSTSSMEERGLRCRCLVPWLAARSKLEMLGTKNLLKNRRLARAISYAVFGLIIQTHVGIQGPVAWKNARQSRQVL